MRYAMRQRNKPGMDKNAFMTRDNKRSQNTHTLKTAPNTRSKKNFHPLPNHALSQTRTDSARKCHPHPIISINFRRTL